MYHDVYIEQFVKRPRRSVDRILYILSFALTVLMGALAALISIGYFTLPFLAFLAVTYYLYMVQYMEFDYTLTNSLLEIEMITGKKRRKPILAVDIKDIVVVARSKSDPVKRYIGQHMKTYDCTSHEDVPYYCMIIRVDGAERKILFEPSEEMLMELKRTNPSKIYVD